MIPSFFMLRASQIEPAGFTPGVTPTNALWCQSANNDSNNGTWFEPPGNIPPGFSVVSMEDLDGQSGTTSEPYQMVRCTGEVGLIRDTGVASHEGLLQCVIRDENNDTHTLTVGVYTGSVYDNYGEDDIYVSESCTTHDHSSSPLTQLVLCWTQTCGSP